MGEIEISPDRNNFLNDDFSIAVDTFLAGYSNSI
jgi:hypothetical protein